MKIYTKTGDSGETGIQGGRRIPKSDPRIMAYGSLDEANSILGMAAGTAAGGIRDVLVGLQNDLFVLGADLSDPDAAGGAVRVTPEMTRNMESLIDDIQESLPPLTQFILPGGGRAGSLIHLARAVVRRAETHMASIPDTEPLNPECLRYANRLSDLLFVLARKANVDSGADERAWTGQPFISLHSQGSAVPG